MVVDWRDDWVGIGVARLLAATGHEVSLVTPGYFAGASLQQYVRDEHLAALARAGVDVLTLVRLFGVDDDSVYLQHVLTDEPVIVDRVSAVVLATGRRPSRRLADELVAAGVPVELIGDCLAPRTVEEAVLDGLRVASVI